MYFCSRQVCFKELKIKLILPNLKHGAQKSHSEACSLKKCTLPYIYFVFKCLVLYFGIKKEWLEKKLANILKGFRSGLTLFSIVGYSRSLELLECTLEDIVLCLLKVNVSYTDDNSSVLSFFLIFHFILTFRNIRMFFNGPYVFR